MPHSVGNGGIFGLVSEDGVAKTISPVMLYDRTTGDLVAKTTSDATGAYQFTGLNPNTSDYFAVALDNDGAVPKNALVKDYLQPMTLSSAPSELYHYWLVSNSASCYWYPPSDPAHWAETTGGSRSHANIRAGIVSSGASLIPSAPSTPSIALTGSYVEVYARPQFTDRRFIQSSDTMTELSVECVLSATTSGLGVFLQQDYDASAFALGQLTGSQYNANGMLYNHAQNNNFCFSVYHTGTSVSARIVLSDNTVYTLTAAATGTRHLVLRFKKGVSLDLFSNGAQVATQSLTSKDLYLRSYGAAAYAFVGGMKLMGIPANYNADNSHALGTGSVGMAAYYFKQLTTAEITARYTAFTTAQPVPYAGVVAEMMLDKPTQLVPMQSGASAQLVSLTHSAASGYTLNPTGASMTSSTPLFKWAGAIQFPNKNAGVLLPTTHIYHGRSATVEFCTKTPAAFPATGLATVVSTVAAPHVDYNNNSVHTHVRVAFNASGNLVLRTSTIDSTTTDTTFTKVFLPATVYHIVVTVDKHDAFRFKLYVNGALEQAVVSSSAFLRNITYDRESCVWVGTQFTYHLVSASPYEGSVAGLAFYAYPLSATRVAAHYTALTS